MTAAFVSPTVMRSLFAKMQTNGWKASWSILTFRQPNGSTLRHLHRHKQSREHTDYQVPATAVEERCRQSNCLLATVRLEDDDIDKSLVEYILRFFPAGKHKFDLEGAPPGQENRSDL